MRVPPVIFMPEKVHCPACYAADDRGEDTCRHCGFSAELLAERFPIRPPDFARIMDTDGMLPASELRRLNRDIDAFEARFPQFRVALCLTRLPGDFDVRQAGFWLMNFSPLSVGETPEDREATLLFLIDHRNRRVGLTTGYRLDPFLGDDRGRRILASVRESLQQDDFAGAVTGALAAIRKFLTWQWRIANELAERYRRNPRPDLQASR